MRKRFPLIVQELLLLIMFYGMFFEFIILITNKNKLFSTIGLLAGVLLAMGMCIHMQISLDRALEMGESGARKHITMNYGIRIAVIFLTFGIMFYFKVGSIITCFIGIMGLKVAAYLQPFTHKFLQKYLDKGR